MAGLRVGTSGWHYSHWRGLFYPAGMKQADWLEYYSRKFDTVEINATFYRLPKPGHLDGWHASTPKGFLFALKGSRFLTHMKRLGDSGEALDRFFDLISRLSEKAGPALWQLPPDMKRDDDRLASFVGALPAAWRHSFEFRHQSWFCDEVYSILDNAGAALCLADHPERPQPMEITAGWTYIRLHQGSGGDGIYSAGELKAWSRRITGYLDDGLDVFVYFNNDQQGYALENAQELKRLL